jgi:TATA-binding protein-associated factor
MKGECGESNDRHIIKNGKTKLSKAIKTVKAMKRVILSGTPISNSVLELVSFCYL